MKKEIFKSILLGLLGTILLLGFYFIIVSSVSGRVFARFQFLTYWYFIISLAVGFGIQVGLFVYFKNVVRQRQDISGKTLAVSGATSGVAMISCCAHYLVNIVPIIGATGLIGIIGQYQIEIFWIGLIFNAGGIIYIVKKVIDFKKHNLS